MEDIVKIICHFIKSQTNDIAIDELRNYLLHLERFDENFEQLELVAKLKDHIEKFFVAQTSNNGNEAIIHFEKMKLSFLHDIEYDLQVLVNDSAKLSELVAQCCANNSQVSYQKLSNQIDVKKGKFSNFYSLNFDDYDFECVHRVLMALRVDCFDIAGLTKLLELDAIELIEHPQWEELLTLLYSALMHCKDNEVLVYLLSAHLKFLYAFRDHPQVLDVCLNFVTYLLSSNATNFQFKGYNANVQLESSQVKILLLNNVLKLSLAGLVQVIDILVSSEVAIGKYYEKTIEIIITTIFALLSHASLDLSDEQSIPILDILCLTKPDLCYFIDKLRLRWMPIALLSYSIETGFINVVLMRIQKSILVLKSNESSHEIPSFLQATKFSLALIHSFNFLESSIVEDIFDQGLQPIHMIRDDKYWKGRMQDEAGSSGARCIKLHRLDRKDINSLYSTLLEVDSYNLHQIIQTTSCHSKLTGRGILLLKDVLQTTCQILMKTGSELSDDLLQCSLNILSQLCAMSRQCLLLQETHEQLLILTKTISCDWRNKSYDRKTCIALNILFILVESFYLYFDEIPETNICPNFKIFVFNSCESLGIQLIEYVELDHADLGLDMTLEDIALSVLSILPRCIQNSFIDEKPERVVMIFKILQIVQSHPQTSHQLRSNVIVMQRWMSCFLRIVATSSFSDSSSCLQKISIVELSSLKEVLLKMFRDSFLLSINRLSFSEVEEAKLEILSTNNDNWESLIRVLTILTFVFLEDDWKASYLEVLSLCLDALQCDECLWNKLLVNDHHIDLLIQFMNIFVFKGLAEEVFAIWRNVSINLHRSFESLNQLQILLLQDESMEVLHCSYVSFDVIYGTLLRFLQSYQSYLLRKLSDSISLERVKIEKVEMLIQQELVSL